MAPGTRTLDPERIEMLRELGGGGNELLGEVAHEFEQDTRRQLAAARSALATEDVAALDRCAHTLKGASANLGADQFAQLCMQLQASARGEDFAASSGLIASIEAELTDVVAALHETIAEA